jgi:hypothetical protein
MTVSMALWKAIHDRYELLKVTFDSGRVGAVQAEQLSTLIWGRLDVTPGVGRDAERARVPSAAEGALAVSLPEACRLSDAMTSSLRARLALEPSGLDIGIRVKAIREGIERLRDQIALTPPGAARDKNHRSHRLSAAPLRCHRARQARRRRRRLPRPAGDRRRRPGARPHRRRGSSTSRERARRRHRAHAKVTELAARGDAIRAMQTQCLASLNPAPKLAVPDVRALGAVPDDPDAVDALLARLQLVSRALDQAHETYARALGERDQLLG